MINGNEDSNTSHMHEKTKEQWLYEGIEYLNHKRYAEALTAYEQAIHLDPDLAYTSRKKAEILIRLRRYAEVRALNDQARQKQNEQDGHTAIWKRIVLPEYIFERMLGFSIPLDHQVVIISYEGIHTLDLNAPDGVQHDYAYLEGGEMYDRQNQILEYHGKRFQIVGAYGGQPMVESQHQERLCLIKNMRTLKCCLIMESSYFSTGLLICQGIGDTSLSLVTLALSS
jgi:tetratricopeptide (TPR) repeat protein